MPYAEPSAQGERAVPSTESKQPYHPQAVPVMRASDGAFAEPPQVEGMALPLASPGFVQRTTDGAPDLDQPQQGGRELHVMRASEDTPYADSPPQGERGTSARLPLAPSRVVAVQRTTQTAGEAESESTESPTDGGASTVQGAWYDSISSGARSMASSAGSSAASAAGSTISGVASSLGSHSSAETDMDELAGKLYDRIRTRLKTELLVDRERAGFLTDLR